MPTLRWMTREQDLRAAERTPYRLLDEDVALRVGDPDSPNLLIHGDNLEALKALLPFYAGQVKCIYIDPPFNTGSAFEHYDDGLEHNIWLSLMYVRLQYLRELLSRDGVFAIHLDGGEAAYAKVLIDEVFGRNNYLTTIATTTNAPSGFKSTSSTIFSTANFILLYARERITKPLRKLFIPKPYDSAYSKYLLNPSEHFSKWKWTGIVDQYAKENGYETAKLARKLLGETLDSAIADFAIARAENVFRTAAIGGGAAIKRRATIEESRTSRDIVFQHPHEDVPEFLILNGEQILFYRDRLYEVDGEKVPAEVITDVWTDISWTGIAREGGVDFKNGKKPEELIRRVLEMTTSRGDLVLDSFLGSGTTAAVAQKMGRRWIGVEIGDHAVTHCAPRLQRVIEGEQSGVSRPVGWTGGGGFRFFRLGPAVFDETGRIQPDIAFGTLAAHIWFSETGTPLAPAAARTPFLGAHGGAGFALLYNGVLGDRRAEGGNVLTRKTLAVIRESAGGFAGPLVVYGERTALGPATMARERVTFRQTPYDVKARR